MKAGPDIAPVAALIGDPARANMLTALMAGGALTAGELAREAGVTSQTASAHLAKLSEGGLVAARRQGRHRFFALADPEVASTLEALMGLAARAGRLRTRPGPKDPALRRARVCYNHLAGEMGVALFDAWRDRGLLQVASLPEAQIIDGDEAPTEAAALREAVALTPEGRLAAEGFGVDLAGLEGKRAPLCRSCLDWSVRRTHLAGSLGRALLSEMFRRGWAKRDEPGRAVRFTRQGEAAFAREILGASS